MSQFVPHTLTATVEPADATNRTITWSVTNAGTTGAVITGSTLTTSANGTVTISATITNGTAEGTDFSTSFILTITTPITNTDDLATYLTAENGGQDANSPIPVLVVLELSDANWNAILAAIDTADKFVSLNLSSCTKSSASSGGGLYSSGDFDPVYDTDTGKAKIVNLTLPTLATGIVAGT